MQRIEKIKELRRLLSGEPEPPKQKVWIVYVKNGVEKCETPGYPDEVNHRDLVIRLVHEIIK